MSSLIHLTDLNERRPKPEDYLIFGGTFDPVHQGHISVIRRMLPFFRHLIIAPATANPWKKEKPTALPLRVEMIRRVLKWEALPLVEQKKESGVFIEPGGYIYAAEYASQVRQEISGELYWVIGEDLQDSVMKWRNWRTASVTAVVVPITLDLHATEIRQGTALPHPAIRDFCAAEGLYSL